jgi:hypothetical protein
MADQSDLVYKALEEAKRSNAFGAGAHEAHETPASNGG